jgi:hypothetical protein
MTVPLLDAVQLGHSYARWQASEISDASYAALYFLHWQSASHGKRFASRRHRSAPRPDATAWFAETAPLNWQQIKEYLLNYFEQYQFLGIIGNVPLALTAWLKGEWPLTLCGYIPSPSEVLAMQVQGTRPVTVISSWPRMMAPVLSKPNAFAFMVHDLEHAWKFFHDPTMHRQQRQFFYLLSECLEAGCFDQYLLDPIFLTKFDYLSSDMNTHVMHASQFLRAIVVEYYLRQENIQTPAELSATARQNIRTLMSDLLGAEWLLEVEKRMVQASPF